MEHKGYKATVTFDAEDELFVGRVAGLNDVVGFHADNVSDLKRAFHEALDDYLDACRVAGKQPERSYSGNMMLRVDPELHRQAAIAAELAGMSLNQWGAEMLRWGAEQGISLKGALSMLEAGTLTPADLEVMPFLRERLINALETALGSKPPIAGRKDEEASPSNR